MTLDDLLRRLRGRDIRVWIEGDRLRVNAPRGALDAELQSEMTRLKPELLRWLQEGAAGASAPPLVPVPRGSALPLSHGQSRLWFLQQLEPTSSAYVLCVNATLSNVNLPVLNAAVTELVRRHEILRTTIGEDHGQPRQRVHKPGPILVDERDLRGLPAAERWPEVSRLTREVACAPFDLARGPLVRFVLFHLDDRTSELVIAQHHIISDGWSQAIILRELSTLYQAFEGGRPSPLPEPTLHYADYAVWQGELLKSPAVERQIEYWRNELADLTPLELPGDRPRPALQRLRGATQAFQLSAALTDAIKAVSRSAGVTVHMTLLAAFGTFLRLWSGQTDVAIGTANGNRRNVELEQLIGFFVDTQVLRLDLSGNPSFLETIRRVSTKALAAHANQDVPFGRLVEILRPTRDLSRSALCDVMFILQNTPIETEIRSATRQPHPAAASGQAQRPSLFPASEVSAGGPTRLLVETGASKLDLTLYVEEGPLGYRGTVEYNTDLFDHETITRAIDRFEMLLEFCVCQPEAPLSSVPRMTAAERAQLAEWNATSRASRGVPWHEMVTAQAMLTPNRTAVRCGDMALSYAELVEHAGALAAALRARGVGSGHTVGLLLDRSAAVPGVMLGVARTGAAYVPLDPVFPRDRLDYMIRDARLSAIVCDDTTRELAQQFGVPLVASTDGPGQPNGSAVPAGAVNPADLAYVIYTSGSTGRPKGVEVPHRALTNFLESMALEPGFAPGETLLAVTTLSFDIAALEMMLPLLRGGTVAIARREESIDPVALQAALVDSGAAAMQATPITWRMLLDTGWTPPARFRALCGGEAMPRELAEQLIAAGVELWNLYGPTETTVWSTIDRVTSAAGRLPIGRPIANTQIHIVDGDGIAVPPGAVGEICIAGLGLAQGYRGRPDLTAERFVADAAGEPGRMYRTGDRGRWRSDGRLECFGRIDHQVKVRGFRIELGEVEAVLAADPAVRQALVHVWGEGASARLVAYVVAQQGASIDHASLRDRVARALPAYMHPATFVVLSALPLTANGKVDRKALPEPDATRPELPTAFAEPQNEIEERVLAIWQQVFGITRIGVHDDFFGMGGHSLLATQILSRVRAEFEMPISLYDFFAAPTITGLSDALLGRLLEAEMADPAVGKAT